MAYCLKLEIPWLPKSLNTKLRKNRHANNRENYAWDNYIAAVVHNEKPHAPLERAHVSIVRYSHRMLDFDGLVGSLKPVVDALVSAGVIRDDSWKVLGRWNVNQDFRPKSKGPFLEITVLEV